MRRALHPRRPRRYNACANLANGNPLTAKRAQVVPSGTSARAGLSTDMRVVLASLVLLSACSSGGTGNDTSAQPPAPAPKPTGPAPQTPVTGLTPAPGKAPSWIGARDGSDAPATAPYGNLLDQPVVNGASANP